MPRSDLTRGYSDGDSLVGEIVREEGHIYSLAATNDLLYTGSDNNYIRVWKNLNEFSGFKSNSGLVKAIVISREAKVFTGHQDGKIRVWKTSSKNPRVYTRAGSLPALKDVLKSSVKPSNYVEVRRRRTALWIKHSDAVSCLSLAEDQGLLYSASWDRTVKVWRIHDLKCIESIKAHDDAVNSVTTAESLVFTGSADGTVKVWKREIRGKRTAHSLFQTLLKQESAVTALVTSHMAVYSGSSDGAVNFWEMGDKKLLKHCEVFKKHRLAVLCIAAAGKLLFSGAADKKICVWRREGKVHTCVSVLTGHTGPVKCLAVVEPSGGEEEDGGDGRLVLYSGSLDKSVKVWRVPRH
ncbi:unnamed protein product [Arabidopsis thaliana]|uniref:Transducin/WD40 repeat-like superfamily protein n=1 Tax=Arabidopsis thaliana TaxID=3702 RepID=A0A654EGC8_ARATH|nr:unnamed protein product [Arabidopsis thaliana]VYS48393.1 unnamed protein product [Arabidopsis thaliana]